ncbi:hypothetical protein CHR26_16410 [Pseudomonas putida]|nr:hypothetical protein CHR26_16410 [Pseudomonas putida]
MLHKLATQMHQNGPDVFPRAPNLCGTGDRTVTDECRVTVKQKPRRLPGRGLVWSWRSHRVSDEAIRPKPGSWPCGYRSDAAPHPGRPRWRYRPKHHTH